MQYWKINMYCILKCPVCYELWNWVRMYVSLYIELPYHIHINVGLSLLPALNFTLIARLCCPLKAKYTYDVVLAQFLLCWYAGCCWLFWYPVHLAMYSVDTILCDIRCLRGEHDLQCVCNKYFIFMFKSVFVWCDVLASTVGAVAVICLLWWNCLLHCVSWNIVMIYILCKGVGGGMCTVVYNDI
jgi:hypothetical protein